MRNSVSGAILCSSCLYATAASVDVKGGTKFGYSQPTSRQQRTITYAVLIPPARTCGVTSSHIGPCRKWTWKLDIR